MKKLITLICFLFLIFGNISAQWYVKNYNVADINDLTKEQLQESLKSSNAALFTSSAVAGFGAIIYVIYRYYPPVPDEDPTFLRQLFGDEFSDDAAMVFGGVMFVAGTAAGVAYLGRSLRIKSVINANYPYDGAISISPSMIRTGYAKTYYPGVTFTLSF